MKIYFFRSSRVPAISEDVARDALLKFVESKWRYSSKPARNLTFRELKPVTVYRVRPCQSRTMSG